MEISIIRDYKKVYEIELSPKKFFSNPYNKYVFLAPIDFFPMVKGFAFTACIACCAFDILKIILTTEDDKDTWKKLLSCVSNYLFFYTMFHVVGNIFPLLVDVANVAFKNN